MKLKLKTKVVKAVSPKMADRVDEIANTYLKFAEQEKVANAAKGEASLAIKSLAAKHGESNKKSKIIRGREYVVGYSEVDESKVFSHELANKYLPASAKIKVMHLVQMAKLDVFEELVRSGKIPKAIAEKCFTKGRAGYARVLVKTVEQFERDEELANNAEGE